MAKVANESVEPFAADDVSDIDANLEPTSEDTKINLFSVSRGRLDNSFSDDRLYIKKQTKEPRK